jgi:hypothetical protein
MNRSRSVSETSVGLFAFLDVLMSTMGSLILVLMVVTPKIRQEAVARAAAAVRHVAPHHAIEADDAPKKSPPAYAPVAAPQLPRETVDLNAKLKVQLAELSQKEQDRERLLEANHESLAAAETALQKNQAELEALERRLEQILNAKRRMAASNSKVSSEGIAVESQLASMATRLRTLRGQIAQNSTAYTFVAYDGVTGTTRRPILIECTREHIKFLQENVSLSQTDVSGCTPSYNPVAAGAQALMDYWTTHSTPDEPRPYVLLIVRPSGPGAYGRARYLLERMKEPVGYELLPDDQQLDVPPAIPEAAEVCRKAVENSIAQRVDAFKDVFGTGLGGGRLPGGNGGGTSRLAGSANGSGKSPFDDLGNSLLGGAAHGSAQAASGTNGGSNGGTSAQPGMPGGLQSAIGGTNSTAIASSTGGGLQGMGLAPGDGKGASNTGPLAATATGTGGGTSANPGNGVGGSENRPGSVLVSDRGADALSQTSGAGIGSAATGLGIPGFGGGSGTGPAPVNGGSGNAAGSSPSSGGSGNGVGSLPSNGGIGNGTGPTLSNGATGNGTGPLLSNGSAGNGVGSPPSNGGIGNGAGSPPSNGGIGNGAGSPLPSGGGGNGDRLAGSSQGGLLPQGDGGSPSGTLPSGLSTPRIGTPTSSMPPGSASSGGLAPLGEVAGAGSLGAVGEADQGGLPPSLVPPSLVPPSLVPPSGPVAAANAAMNDDKLAVGHPTPGSADDAMSGQSTTTTAGLPNLDAGLPGSVGSTAAATTASPTGAGGSGSPGVTDSQPGESLSSMPGSSGQPQTGESGGSPSMGSPSTGPPPDGASDGDPGPSASSDSSSKATGDDSGSALRPSNADEDDAPRRKAQSSARHWGISSSRASIGYEHDLRLYIEAGRISVGNQPPIPCGRRENGDQLALAVLRAVNREARTWGRPRDNFYWVPSLKIVVCAGGMLQYERLQPAFERQGLSSAVEFRLEQSRPAPLPRLVTD